MFSNLDEADKVLIDFNFNNNFLVGLIKDYSEIFEGYVPARAYSPKYERFLRNNNIQFEYYDITKSDWLEKASRYDLIIWHMDSFPVSQMQASSKIYLLEKKMNKKCIPSYDELWSYEDKINSHYLYSHYQLPEIPTFVSFDKDDSFRFIEQTQFPLISKITTGAGSMGVSKINNKSEAVRLINSVFSYRGKQTYWPYLRQKGYVFLQQCIPNARFDLRVIVVGNKLFGYYRFPKENDFKGRFCQDFKMVCAMLTSF